ncbi:MAG: hypothetical protein A3B47_02265 [Candidatus Levybacteria bacterium RIFCSPLOWO2_01_FULL_39_24]|nr:MAG: hypothetical protein A2800_01560 [Candidatus Levybacteria bacterium RIFCSPHIGHO2_01_FULL_40_16]OGH28381.1 MAG: hypothetical protein A3E12_01870 [Candidatus Levybacteria bacterium RIFCSPHIGHO2_12_FULL_39_9]OGH46460.1 MAG: hypothetical protein A3B47_02265 [Candidatus Levybacteria bacterium RIFCSPLOWO2_01_FULL_39_24]
MRFKPDDHYLKIFLNKLYYDIMIGIEIKGNIRDQFCLKNGHCDLQRLFIDGQQKDQAEGGMSLQEIKELCSKEGLKPSNDYYGSAIPNEMRKKISNVIFTADCTAGKIKGTNYTNCGSVCAYLTTYEPESKLEELAVKVIKAQWLLNNR